MTALRFLDTDILLYSISRDRREAVKRERAIALLERDDIGLFRSLVSSTCRRRERRAAMPCHTISLRD
jgi:predicted nucleic acid-binding protein